MNTGRIKEVEGKEAGCTFSSYCRLLYETGLHSYKTIRVTGNFRVEGCVFIYTLERSLHEECAVGL